MHRPALDPCHPPHVHLHLYITDTVGFLVNRNEALMSLKQSLLILFDINYYRLLQFKTIYIRNINIRATVS